MKKPNSIPTLCLVGVGGFGRSHLNLLREFEETGKVRLTDVVDPGPERLPEEKQMLDARGVTWHTSWEALENGPGVPDCVIIAAPIHLHFDYAAKAYRAGAYVYLEKPPVPLLGEIEELMRLEAANPRIQIGFTFPFASQMQTLCGWLQEGKLGKILHYRITACWPREDNYYQRNNWAGRLGLNGRAVLDGPATNALSHRIQDLLHLEAACAGGPAAPEWVLAELYHARPIESYDVSSFRGAFPSGAEFSVALSHACADAEEVAIRVTGESGSATLHGGALHLASTLGACEHEERGSHRHTAMQAFLDALAQGSAPVLGLPETKPYVQLTNAAFLSSGTIHPIAAEFAPRIHCQRGMVHNVRDLGKLTGRVAETGKNFSELGAPWGVAGTKIASADLDAAAVDRWFASVQ